MIGFDHFKYKIYKITNSVTLESFIGYSETPDAHIKEYLKTPNRVRTGLLKSAVRIFGEDIFMVAIIDGSNDHDDILQKHIHYVKKFKTTIPYGYNLTLGGAGKLGLKLSEEQKQKISNTKRISSKKISDEDVLDILVDPRAQAAIAHQYGVHQSTIHYIKSGKHRRAASGNDMYCHCIYKFTNNINGKVYIGVTSNLLHRMENHYGHLEQSLFHKAIGKYGWNNFTIKILERDLVSDFLAKSKEIEYIDKFNASNADFGYNNTLGGDGTLGQIGELNSRSKLTNQQAQDIINDSRSHTQIAEVYNTSASTIFMLRVGQTWKHLDRANAPEYYIGNKNISDETAQEIINDSCSATEVSKKHNVRISAISTIRSGARFKHLDRSNAPEYQSDKKSLSDETAQNIINDPCTNAQAARKYKTTEYIVHKIRKGKTYKYLDRSNAPKNYNNLGFKIPIETMIALLKDEHLSIKEAAEKHGIGKDTAMKIRKRHNIILEHYEAIITKT